VQRDSLEREFKDEELMRRQELTELRLQLLRLEQRRRDLEREAEEAPEWQEFQTVEKEYRKLVRDSEKTIRRMRDVVGEAHADFKQVSRDMKKQLEYAQADLDKAKKNWLARQQKDRQQMTNVMREIVELENQVGFLEWQQSMRRGRYQTRLDAVEDRIRRLQEDDLPVTSPRDRSLELERKVEQLIREVSDLRRELRQRPADRSRPNAPTGGSIR
jgi:hypothetical protein